MNAPIFEIAVASSAVRALLGTGSVGDPLRLYSFGDAPQGVALPYAVWRNISGEPFNHLHSRPTQDAFNLQIDIYGADRETVRQREVAVDLDVLQDFAAGKIFLGVRVDQILQCALHIGFAKTHYLLLKSYKNKD